MIIDLQSVFKYYFQSDETTSTDLLAIPALKGIDLTISSRSISLIMGPSGSGKTTLLEIISTNLLTTSGTVIINDIDIGKLKGNELEIFRWNYIGYLKQNLAENFIEDLSFNEMIQFFKNNPLLDNTKIKDYQGLDKYLDLLGLSKLHLDVNYNYLSSGEKQRIGLLFLLFKNPSIFLLDEPTSFLDEINKINVIKLLNELKNENKTIIITSHDQIFYKIADDIYFLKDGTIISQNVLSVLPELVSGSIKVPTVKLNSNFSFKIPHLILKVFNSEKILKFSYLHKKDNLIIQFTLISKSEFYQSHLDDLYFHDEDLLDLNHFIKKPELLDLINETSSYWLIDKDKICLNIVLGKFN